MLNFPRWKVALILLTCLVGVVLVAPNFFSRDQVAEFPSWMPSKQINLGLDLQGGAHLLFEVEVDAVIEERLDTLIDDVRSALRPRDGSERIGYTNFRVEGTAVSFDLVDPAERALAVERIDDLSAVTVGPFGAGARDLEVATEGDRSVTVSLTEAAIEQRKRSAVNQSIEIVRRRIDELGTREPSIQRQGDDRILVQVPGVGDTEELIRTINTTAKMSFRMVDHTTSVEEAQRGRVPPGSELLPSAEDEPGGPRYYVIRKRTLISGDSLVDAQPSFQNGNPVVSFRFDASGAKRFADATRDNVGRLFAIVLDDKVISAPRIREPILGGSGIIEGNFTVEGANELAVLLRAGALPAPLSILEQRSVGPDLGADSVAAGEIAAIIGFSAVVIFILVSYGFFGVIANIALFLNVALIGGALSLLQATLTLPGIAGIVLTIGMAVDANVLVFERIREEAKAGKNPFAAIDAGYSKALSTILDANITTLIAAAILFEFGSGPVKGFAVTLAIGILTSVFTALMLTRLMLATWIRRKRPQSLPI
jgi:preprotein translocase subunit SecD